MTEEKATNGSPGKGLGTGLALGLTLGAALGITMDNLALWLGVGVALGLCLGVAYDARATQDGTLAGSATDTAEPPADQAGRAEGPLDEDSPGGDGAGGNDPR